MNKIKLASGIIKTVDQEYELAGISVLAFLPAGFPDLPGAALSERLEIGRTVTKADGTFELFLSEKPPAIAYACYLEHCYVPGIQLECRDNDFSLLWEVSTAPIAKLQNIRLAVDAAQEPPNVDAWQQFGSLIRQSSIIKLDQVVQELTQLSPQGIFQAQTVRQRLNYLYRLETTLIDPDDAFLQADLPIRLSQIRDETTRTNFRKQAAEKDISGLTEAFDSAVLKANLIGSYLKSADILLDIDAFIQGDIKAGVNRFFDGRAISEITRPRKSNTSKNQRFPWLRNSLTGYRDYLIDIWVKRVTRPLQLGQVLDANGVVEQLGNRFHQDFTTTDAVSQTACPIINSILLKILIAPTGTGFGFAIAPDTIQPQGDRSDRDYLNYLILLTGIDRHELENRYRLDLSLTNFDQLSYVQQNINTLQRFFTDSFQSVYDPSGILPPHIEGRLPEPIIYDFTNGERGFHGPFFWQYEEWAERNEPFYAENYFDIRRIFSISLDKEYGDVKDGTIALTDFIRRYTAFWGSTADPMTYAFRAEFTPPEKSLSSTKNQERKIVHQWVRNLIEIENLLDDTHQKFFSGFYAEAERQYLDIAESVTGLNSIIQNWRKSAWDIYVEPNFANEQSAFKIQDADSLKEFEGKYHLRLRDRFWIYEDQDTISNRMGRIPYLLNFVLTRLLPICLFESRVSLGKYQEAIHGDIRESLSNPYGVKVANLSDVLGFRVFSGPTPVEPGAKTTPPENVWWRFDRNAGSLPYSTDSTQDIQKNLKDGRIPLFPANVVEKAFFRLKLGSALLEWADTLYRTNLPQNIGTSSRGSTVLQNLVK
jgi:hypothetical protein